MSPRRLIALLAVLAAAVTAGGLVDALAAAGSLQTPHGLAPELRPARGLVRVVIAYRPPKARRAPGATPAALTGRLSGLQRVVLGRSRAEGRAIYRANHARRVRALRALQPAVLASGREARPLMRWLLDHRARALTVDPLTATITASTPGHALRALARRRDVLSVTRAVTLTPLACPQTGDCGVFADSLAVGAPSFWAAGFTGGVGPSDTQGANLAIDLDPIQETHPAFRLRPDLFEHPQHAGTTASTLHGTEVASVAASQGTTSCPANYTCSGDDVAPTYKGVAYGAHKILDAAYNQSTGYSAKVWELGLSQTDPNTFITEPGASNVADVATVSRGSFEPGVDDNADTQGYDLYSSQFGLPEAMSAGNDGPGQSVSSPCIAYDSMCTGAVSYGYSNGTVDHSGDQVTSYSSRGPTPLGRKKPDLVAVGDVEAANYNWQLGGSQHIWRGDTGTSFAAPQVGGAMTLLYGSGITDPLAIKAVLIDSARLGRSSSTAAMGTQTGWQPDWGWGELNLTQALAQRTNFATGQLPGGSVRFYRSTVGAGDRATLTWNRRVTGCLSYNVDDPAKNCNMSPGPTAYTLSNLDLYELDATTGAARSSSTSAIDNVEQTRAPAAGTVVYKVKANSTVDGAPASEPFALATRPGLTALANPQPIVHVTSSTGQARTGQPVTVTATVRNRSGDLTGENAQATLVLPAGVQLAPGSAPAMQGLGTLAADGSTSVSWTVQGTSDGLKALTVLASTFRYGETFTGGNAALVFVDGTPPAVEFSLSARSQTTTAIPLSWSATDSGVGLGSFDVMIGVDGAPFAPLLSGTTTTSMTYTGTVGHSYRFEVLARDRLGNESAPIGRGPVTITSPPPPPALRRAGVKITFAAIRRGVLSGKGTISRGYTHRLTVVFAGTYHHRRVRLKTTAVPRRGAYTFRQRLPRFAARVRTGTVTVTAPKQTGFRAGTATRRIR